MVKSMRARGRRLLRSGVASVLAASLRIAITQRTWRAKRRPQTLTEQLGPLDEAGPRHPDPLRPPDRATADSTLEVSFVVPVYNAESRLDRCLDSLLGQHGDIKYEVICVDDGSTDRSLQILREHAARDSRVQVVAQANAGVAAARNAGVAAAQGRYVAFVDNDDQLGPDFTQITLAAADRHDADIVRAGYVEIDEETGRTVGGSSRTPAVVTEGLGPLLLELDGYAWGTLFRRDLFELVRFPPGYWFEDMVTRTLLYRLADTFVYTPQRLYTKHVHASNASKSVWSTEAKKSLDQYYLLEQVVARSRELSLPTDTWAYLLYLAEAGPFLHGRTRHLDPQLRRRVFAATATLLAPLVPELADSRMTPAGRAFHQALRTSDFDLWVTAGNYCKWAETTDVARRS